MLLEGLAHAVDRVEGGGGHVPERPPMIRDKHVGLEALEQCEGILVGEVAFPETRLLPPRSPANREEGEIEGAAVLPEILFHQTVGVLGERGVTSEKEALLLRVQ